MFREVVASLVCVCLMVSGCQSGPRMRTGGTTPPSSLPAVDAGSSVPEASDPGGEEELPPLPEIEPLPPVSPEERQVGLRAGRAAPFDGVLLSPEAWARIEVEFRVLRQQFVLDLERQRRELTARRERDTRLLELRLRTQEQEHRVLVEGRDREIRRLQASLREAVDSGSPSTLVAVLSSLGGVVVGAILGWLVGTLSN